MNGRAFSASKGILMPTNLSGMAIDQAKAALGHAHYRIGNESVAKPTSMLTTIQDRRRRIGLRTLGYVQPYTTFRYVYVHYFEPCRGTGPYRDYGDKKEEGKVSF